MTVEEFSESADLYGEPEIEKVKLLTYFYTKTNDKASYTPTDVAEWFGALYLPEPNKSRLLDNIRTSRSFIKGEGERSFILHGKEIQALDEEFDSLEEPSEDVESFDTILPASLYEDTRGYIERLAKQINASYENNIFDGCAVLMRRLTEVLVILSYKNLAIESSVKSGDRYDGLKTLINKAIKNKTLDLSTDARKCIDTFRQLGNFSAHRIHYNCRKDYIQEVIPQYRILVEEMLHKADLLD